ncbi:histidine kinase dimerization/phosphoacceptor domain -containing protein [Flavobacterium psychrotrophum]|uniref:histidine kinase dimerization/phosphoacceptor domain -containing protein n=1 Tax=Flavobacterium psychrotrophum TaxID=2294119 RepID=UPI000E314D67|nr:histidine kinase dimerization/phosphoacceptor domain -containing protein [Flavobacterium psychrotrophum]
MIRLLLLLSTIFFSLGSSAQSTGALRNKLLSAKGEKQKIAVLNQLAEVYLDPYHPAVKAADSAFYFADEALKHSVVLKDNYAVSHSKVLLARSYNQLGQKSKATTFAKEALELATAKNFQDARGEALEELYNQLNFYDELEQKTTYLEQALEAYGKKSTKKQLANILTLASDHYNYVGNNVKAIELGERSLAIYKTISGASLTNTYRVLGNNYFTAGLNKKAIEYFLQAARYGEELNREHELLSYTYNQLAIIYSQLSDDQLCLKYLYKSLHEATVINDKQAIYTALNNISGLLVKLKKYKESESVLARTSSRYPPELKIDKITLQLCFLHNYVFQKDFAKAARYCKALHVLADNSGSELPAPFIYNMNIAFTRYYLGIKDFEKARLYLDRMKPFADKSEGYNRKKMFYMLAYQVDSTQGNYIKAIENLNKVRVADDSLFDISKNNEISRLQIEYETEKKDKDILLKTQNIKLLGKETELQKSRTKDAQLIRNISLGIILLVVIFFIILYRAYKSKQKTNELLYRQQAEITDKNNILSHLVDEKEWLLKEVHHRVKNNLQIVMSLLNSQSAYLKDKAAVTAIKDSQRRVHAMSLIHQKLYQAENLSSINMKTYISELVYFLKDTFDDGNIDFITNVDNVDFDVSQVVPVGLILNEAITNSVKYAFKGKGRGQINISFKNIAAELYELRIADNGGGITIDIEDTDSLGMNLIRGLGQDLNGTFEMYNEGGAVIKITFTRDMHIKPAS